MEARIRIWAIHDGRAGHAAQALGLAEALARRRPAEIMPLRIEPKPWAARLPARLWLLGGARPGGWPFSGYGHGMAGVAPPWPDLTIGAGRRVAPLLAALRRLNGVRAVQILDPGVPPAAFDLVVAPAHDGLAGPNVVSTLGALNRVTPEGLAAAAAAWRERLAHLPRPRLAVLLGGPSRSAFWSEADVERFAAEIALLTHRGAGVMLTPSPRSDPMLLAALRAECDPASSYIWDGTGENPYPAILGLAEAAIVTEDSVSMASEAATAGLPLHLFRLAGTSARLRAFHAELAGRGIARDFTGALGRWSYPPLAEADRVAGEIERRLLAV